MPDHFAYQGYDIPVDLLNLTGGGTDTWHEISVGHMREYQAYCPIAPDHAVLEIGCGVGRDAIQLTEVLGSNGSYLGIDIIRPSIEWCQRQITRRHPNFRFKHIDIRSQIHNPGGTLAASQVRLPARATSIDRVILQSVFTHMFEADITHYLGEFHRVLRPGGLVFASFFVVDEESLSLARRTRQTLLFEHPWGDGCRVNDPRYPEGAVGYTEEALDRMFGGGGMRLIPPIHRGFWCGREATLDGQDICILEMGSPPGSSVAVQRTPVASLVRRLLRRP